MLSSAAHSLAQPMYTELKMGFTYLAVLDCFHIIRPSTARLGSALGLQAMLMIGEGVQITFATNMHRHAFSHANNMEIAVLAVF